MHLYDVLVCHLYVTRRCAYLMVCHSYVLVYHSHVTRMSSVCHLHVLVCHPVCHLDRLSYVTRMPLVCTSMSSVFHSSVVLSWTLPKVNLSQCLAEDLRIQLRINELFLFHSDLSFSCYWKKKKLLLALHFSKLQI